MSSRPYWADLAAFARAENPDLLVCIELHPGTAVYNVATFEALIARSGPSLAANFDPSHFFWMGMDGHQIADASADRSAIHGKDTSFNEQNLALNGLLDHRWPSSPESMPWNFAVPGRGHDLDVVGRPDAADSLRSPASRSSRSSTRTRSCRLESACAEAARLLTRAISRRAMKDSEEAMTTVRAAVMEAPGPDRRCASFRRPEPEPGAVVMQCASPGSAAPTSTPSAASRKQYAGTAHERDLSYPLICGHENVGTRRRDRRRRCSTPKGRR